MSTSSPNLQASPILSSKSSSTVSDLRRNGSTASTVQYQSPLPQQISPKSSSSVSFPAAADKKPTSQQAATATYDDEAAILFQLQGKEREQNLDSEESKLSLLSQAEREGTPTPTPSPTRIKVRSIEDEKLALDRLRVNEKTHRPHEMKRALDTEEVRLNQLRNAEENPHQADSPLLPSSNKKVSFVQHSSSASKQQQRNKPFIMDEPMKKLQLSENTLDHNASNSEKIERDFAIRIIQRGLSRGMDYKKHIAPIILERRLLKSSRGGGRQGGAPPTAAGLQKYKENPELKALEDRVEMMIHEQNWAAFMLGRTWRSILSKRRGKETDVVMGFAAGGTKDPELDDINNNNTKKRKTQQLGSLLRKTERDEIPLKTNGRHALALAYVFQFAANEDATRKNSSPFQIESFREQQKLAHLVKERTLQKQREKEIEQVKGPMAALLSKGDHRQKQMGGHDSFFGSFIAKNQDSLDIWKSYNEKTTFRWRFLYGLHALYDSILSHRPGSKIGQLLLAKTVVPEWSSMRECVSLASVKLNGQAEAAQPPSRNMVCFRRHQEEEEMEEEEKKIKEFEEKYKKNHQALPSKKRLQSLRKSYQPKNQELLRILDSGKKHHLQQQQQPAIVSSAVSSSNNNNRLSASGANADDLKYLLDTPHRQQQQQQQQQGSGDSSNYFPGSLPRMNTNNNNSSVSKSGNGKFSQNTINNSFASPAPSLPNPVGETADRMQNSEEKKRNFGEHEHSWIEEQRRLEEEFGDDDDDDEENGYYDEISNDDDDESENVNEEFDEFEDSGYCSFGPTSPIDEERRRQQQQQQDDGGGIDFGGRYGDEQGVGYDASNHHQQQQQNPTNGFVGLPPRQKSKSLSKSPPKQIELTQHQLRKQEIKKNDLFFRRQQFEQKMLKQIMTNKEFLAENPLDQQQQQPLRSTTTMSMTLPQQNNIKSSTSPASPTPFQPHQQSSLSPTQASNHHHHSSLPQLREETSSSPNYNNNNNNIRRISPSSHHHHNNPHYASPKAPATLEDMLRRKTVNPTAIMDALPRGDMKIATRFQVVRQELLENLGRIGGLGGKAPSSMTLMGSKKSKKSKSMLGSSSSVSPTQNNQNNNNGKASSTSPTFHHHHVVDNTYANIEDYGDIPDPDFDAVAASHHQQQQQQQNDEEIDFGHHHQQQQQLPSVESIVMPGKKTTKSNKGIHQQQQQQKPAVYASTPQPQFNPEDQGLDPTSLVIHNPTRTNQASTPNPKKTIMVKKTKVVTTKKKVQKNEV